MKHEQTAQSKFTLMTETPIPPLIGKMSAPAIVSMLISSLYNMADTFFVGRLGTSATGAVGIAFSLMSIIQAMGFTFGHGSGNYISRRLGAQDTETAAKMAATGFVSSFIAGMLVTLLGFVLLDPLVRVLGATETIAPYAKDYMRYILIGAPFMTSSLTLNNQLRFQGSAFYGMIGMGLGALVNIALDPLLIFVCDMGVAGAALATILSQMLGFVLLLCGTYRGGNIAVRIKNFSPKWKLYREIIRGGFPSLCRQGLGSVSMIVLNVSAGVYGDAAIAAMSIVNRVVNFVLSTIIGVGQGFQPVCGFNYGAKKYDRVRKAFLFCTTVCTAILLVLSIAGVIFAPQIIGSFIENDAEVSRIGTEALRYQLIVFPLAAYVTIAGMMLQTMGKPVQASIVAMSRQMLLFCVLLVLPRMLGLVGVEVAQAVAEVIAFGIALPLGIGVLREMSRQEAEEK